jgi:hypothetical protein
VVLQLGVGRGANNPSPLKSNFGTKYLKAPPNWTDSLARPHQWKRDMRFGTWNFRSLCRVDTIRSVVGELEKYKLDSVGVQRG